MKFKIVLVCLILPFLMAACSSSQNISDKTADKSQGNVKKDSLYVFDAVPTTDTTAEKPDTSKTLTASRMLMTYYVVQIGAFTTKDRADEFAAESKGKIKYKITVQYNSEINLYVVQLLPEYTSHDEAERVRNELWQTNDFSDAWITTEQK